MNRPCGICPLGPFSLDRPLLDGVQKGSAAAERRHQNRRTSERISTGFGLIQLLEHLN